MLVILIVVLLVLYGGGLGFHVGGDFIHILIVVALICVILNYWPAAQFWRKGPPR